MTYLSNMEVIDCGLMDTVLAALAAYDGERYTAADVEIALRAERLDSENYAALLSPAAGAYLEQMAQRAKAETERHFGKAVALFTPLYIANYCGNHCVYCGFNCHNQIHRGKLTLPEIEREMAAIAKSGLKEILLLTGESRQQSDVVYIGEAAKIARKYFTTIGLEIYPLNSDEYAYLKSCGVDFVTVFQETFDQERYAQVHLSGPKRVFAYRFNAQERALMGGMRGVGFGALLGLADWRKDAFATGLQAYYLQKKYPHAEIAFSCPRLRPYLHGEKTNPQDVHESQLLQVMLAYRIFMPFAGLTISTRERAGFRDHVLGLAATKISAGVSVGVGGHDDESKGDAQFDISDSRSVQEVCEAILAQGLQPLFTDNMGLESC